MLELREYSYAELAKYLRCSTVNGLTKKLKNYEIEYVKNGRGESCTYTITEISNPFKVFAVFDMDVPSQVDFKKLSYFFYELLQDQYYGMGAEMIEEKLRGTDHPISRQTISHYLQYAKAYNLIDINTRDFVYYRVYKRFGVQVHDVITREEYAAAWKHYWQMIYEEDYDSSSAFRSMYNTFKGAPRKQGKIERNGIYNDLVKWLLEILEKDLNEFNKLEDE